MKISNLDTYLRRRLGTKALTRDAIENIQLEGLNALLKRESVRGGFYKNLPEKLQSLSELSALPFTTAADLAAKPGAFLLTSQAEVQKIITGATSGTTGGAKRVFYTKDDCQNTVEFFAAGLSELIDPGGRTMICMPFSGAYGLGELIAEAIKLLGAVPIKAGVGLTLGEYQRILISEKPDTFVGMPAQLLSILKFTGAHGIRRALVSGDACPSGVLSAIESGFNISLFPHYGSREMALGGAVTCPAHKGMHLRENHIIAEITDENGAPLPAGEWGELVITTIGMEAMPLIRYRTGDYTRILPEKCPCGSELLRLDSVSRRDGGMADMDGVILPMPGVVDYSVEHRGGRFVLTALTTGTVDENAIAAGAAQFLGAQSEVRTRLCGAGERLLYSGKRIIEGETK